MIVAEEISKVQGVWTHIILFDRSTGSIIAAEQLNTEPGGFGVHNFYLNGLKDAAKTVVRMVKWALRHDEVSADKPRER